MQLVSLDDLKKLQASSIYESTDLRDIGPGFSFKDVCFEYSSQKHSLKAQLNGDFDAQYRPRLYSWLKNAYLKDKCPPILLVGKGSSRTAFACLGGKCLKVAMNNAGAAQNQQEQKHTQKKHWWSPTYRCFASTYGSNDDFGLLLSECCAQIEKPSQLAQAFGMDDIDVFRAAIRAISTDKKKSLQSASHSLKSMASDYANKGKNYPPMLEYAKVAEVAASWLDSLHACSHSRMTPGQKSFSQLVLFWKKNGTSELLPGDVVNDENWGLAIRDGQIAPVMLDAGFSQDVASKFYR